MVDPLLIAWLALLGILIAMLLYSEEARRYVPFYGTALFGYALADMPRFTIAAEYWMGGGAGTVVAILMLILFAVCAVSAGYQIYTNLFGKDEE